MTYYGSLAGTRSAKLIKLLGASVFVSLLLPLSAASAQTFSVCHGYDCYYRTKVALSAKDELHIQNLLKKTNRSADDVRKALCAVIELFE